MAALSQAVPPGPRSGAASLAPARAESDARRVARLLRRFLVGGHRLLGLALLMLIAEAVTSIFAAYPLSYLIDYLKGDRPDLLRLFALHAVVSPRVLTIAALTVAIVLMAMINSAADSMAEIYLARVGRMLGFQLRVGVYDHLQRLSLAFFNRQRTGDMLTRVTGDVAALEDFVINSLSDVVGSLLVLAGTLAFLLHGSWEVALVAALIVPAVAVVSDYFARRIKAAAKRQRACDGELASAAEEMLTSIGVIQTYGRGGSELGRFEAQNRKTMEVALETARLQALFSWVIKLLEALATAAIVWLGLWLIDRSTITLGTLILFVILIERMFKPTRKIIREWNRFGKMYASAERIGELLERAPAVRDEPGARPAPRLSGHIEYRHVSFAYPVEDDSRQGEAPLALSDVRFEIAPGKALALVGPSGAGKSTIAQLLPRLYDPQTGRVLLDGHDIRGFTLESLRSQMSMVLQETVLFNGTVAANIAYGRDHATREEIVAAALQANAHEFIERLPQGYDTELGERAASLSGGQRQRIAIARAFIRRTPILILDEPTTGLDSESSDVVRKALRSLMKDRTTLIIAHDLNLIRDAHRIAVIREGTVERLGTHEELLEGGGLYADLYGRQFGRAFEEQLARSQPALIPPARLNWTEDFDEDFDVGAEELEPPAPAGRVSDAWSSPRHEPFDERLDPAEIDPRRSPVLRRELPGLATAFDGEAMGRRLQAALLGGPLGRFSIVGCEPGDAAYLPDGTGLVRYRLDVQDAEGGPPHSCLVSGRLLREPRACTAFARDRLMPLAERMRAREELAPLTTPVATIEALSMVLHAYPIDAALPTLGDATDGKRMAEVLSEVLPETLAGSFVIERCAAELVDYARRSRAVLQYRVSGRGPGGAPEERRVFGKVFDGETGAFAAIVTGALRQRVRTSEGASQIRIPWTYAWRRDLRLAVLEAIPGKALLGGLIKARLRGQPPSPGSPCLEEAIETCGFAAALLHTSKIRLGPRRTLEDELRELREELLPILRISPALGARLREHLAELQNFAGRSRPLPLVLSHGDFTRGQLLFDGRTAGLVDFDSVCQAEPALDLGQFQAYLRLAGNAEAESGLRVEPIAARFMAAYLAAVGDRLADRDWLGCRVSLYEGVSMLRRAIRCWQKFKIDRVANAVALLEHELAPRWRSWWPPRAVGAASVANRAVKARAPLELYGTPTSTMR